MEAIVISNEVFFTASTILPLFFLFIIKLFFLQVLPFVFWGGLILITIVLHLIILVTWVRRLNCYWTVCSIKKRNLRGNPERGKYSQNMGIMWGLCKGLLGWLTGSTRPFEEECYLEKVSKLLAGEHVICTLPSVSHAFRKFCLSHYCFHVSVFFGGLGIVGSGYCIWFTCITQDLCS